MKLRISASLGIVLFLCGTGFAASPSLGIVQPRGAQRGTEVVTTFNGVRLSDAQEILIYYPGISVKKLEVVNDAQVKATLAIAADCRLGEHAFRVRTATGISELRTFWVGALPVVEEIEPNSEFEKAQPIALNTTVHGIIQNEDVDLFVVDCKKGQRLSVELEGMRLAGTFFDPHVAILDSKRFELASGDDSPTAGQDAGCSILVPADGKFVIQVRESAYGGNGACQYRLHVGTFPRPTAVVPAGGKPGDEIEVNFLGDPTGPIKQKIKLPSHSEINFRLHCQTADGINPNGLKFRLNDLPNTIKSGPANPQSAMVGSAPGAFNGVIATAGESDFMRFSAKKGQVFDLRCFARQLGSPLDPVLHIHSWTNKTLSGYLATNDDSNGPDSYIRFTVPQDGEFVVQVHDHLFKGGPDYFYRVEVTAIAASTSTGLPKVDGNNFSVQDRQAIAVPKGNRFSTLVNVNRADWGGPAKLMLDKMPAGVSFSAETIDPDMNLVPVVFEAKPDATPNGTLSDFQIKPVDANVKASSATALDVHFAIGANNTPYHKLVTDRIAVAAVESAPFSIEVIEPKVPVVQNGSLNLKVVAKRVDGFKGAITIFPLWTPPGMGIQGSAVIAPESLEGFLPMNAAPNAGPRKWKMAVIALSDAGKGPVWVSSQLFTVEVAPSPLTVTMERPAVEQGQATQLFCKVAVAAPFEGKAKVKLFGLPAKVSSPDLEITKDTKELVFPLTTDKTSPAGKHGGIFCQVIIDKGGEFITLNTGGTELRIDVPLPPKVAVATPPAKPNPTPPPMPNAPPAKRLTRLEQLRLEQEAREKAEKGDPPAPKKEDPKKP